MAARFSTFSPFRPQKKKTGYSYLFFFAVVIVVGYQKLCDLVRDSARNRALKERTCSSKGQATGVRGGGGAMLPSSSGLRHFTSSRASAGSFRRALVKIPE